MARKKPFAIIGIGKTKLKIISFDAANDELLSSAVKDISTVRRKEEKEKFIVSAVKEALGKSAARHAGAFLCLSDDSIQIKRTELPQMPPNEIQDALKWRLKDLVPFDTAASVLDFDVIREKTEEDGAKKIEVIVAAAPKMLVEAGIALLKEAGIASVSGVNIEPFALSNIAKTTPEGEKNESIAILSVNHTDTDVNIYKGAKLVFVRTIPIGLDNIRDSIKERVVSEKGSVELTANEVAKLRSAGIPENEEPLLDGRLKGKDILAHIRPIIENFCNEINHSFDYYNVQLGGEDIKKLYLTGDGSRYRNLDRVIKDTLGVETAHLKLKGKEEDFALEQFISLVGAAKGGLKGKVNLLPAAYRMEKVEKLEKISIRLTGFAVLAALTVSFLLVNFRVGDYKRRLINIKSNMASLQKLKDVYDKTIEREILVNAIKDKETPTVLLMKELSNIIPANVFLRSLAVDQHNKSITFDGTIDVSSEAGEVVIIGLMEAMEKSQFFKNVTLESSKKEVSSKKQTEAFTINCAIER